MQVTKCAAKSRQEVLLEGGEGDLRLSWSCIRKLWLTACWWWPGPRYANENCTRCTNGSGESQVTRCSVKHCEFLNTYMTSLCKMGSLIPSAHGSSWASLHLVAKNSPAKVQETIDFRSVSGAPKPYVWPVSKLWVEAELLLRKQELCFIGLLHGDLAGPLTSRTKWSGPDSSIKGIICRYENARQLENASAYFRSTILPLFAEMQNFKIAWIEDPIIHAYNIQ